MSLEQQFQLSEKPADFGDLFIVGLSGTTLDRTDKEVLKTLRPLGILLLARNFEQTLSYEAWLESLQKLLRETMLYAEREQMMITLDHEGGRVLRTPPPITRFGFASTYRTRPQEVARAMAIELKSLGVNVSWAPVADIHSNPKNPIIGKRAFGTTADEVIEATVPFLKTLQENGILGCAKHFPGHGDTASDSHLELPVVQSSVAELHDRELRPFKALVDAGAPMMMTAHISYPRIDASAPATMSELILKRFLREDIGYKGVVVSDDLDMLAVAEAFRRPEAYGKAIRATCDTFIVARNPDPFSTRPIECAKLLYQALKLRLITEEELFASWSRMQGLKAVLPPAGVVSKLSRDTLSDHAELAEELEKRAKELAE